MSRAKALSIIVPGRNEMFHRHTVEDLLAHTSEEAEIIVVADGGWPDPPIVQHPRVQVIHFGEAVGQRAATNYGAHLSRAKYICKMDAHCSVDEGFDVKMIELMEPDMVSVPAMNRLQAFEWQCECGEREYQGAKPDKCKNCGGIDWVMGIVWKPRFQYEPTVSWRFDADLHFQYFREHRNRPEVQEQMKTGLVETPTCIGACFLMERRRFKWLGGFDERHSSWGQYGVEICLANWLSGGRVVTNVGTWFAHMFRTAQFARSGQSSFPYPLSQRDVDKAREYSRDLWFNNRHPKQSRPLSWLLEKFWPIPGWREEDLKNQKERERDFVPAQGVSDQCLARK